MPKSVIAHQRLHAFLMRHAAGATVAEADLLSAMGWSASSLRTYEGKNKLAAFLVRTGPSVFRTLTNGASISLEQVSHALTQASPKTLALLPGLRVKTSEGHYELVAPIGGGAVGQVWRALSLSGPPPECAVKLMLPRQDLLDPTKLDSVRRRFHRESVNGQRLQHPALIRYIDAGVHAKTPFLVMELAERSAKQVLQLERRVSIRSTRTIVLNAIEGLIYLHAQGCIHRDIKPDNLLATPRGFVLGDLGIVRWGDLNPEFTGGGTVTRASIQLGSWYYMAPEQQEDPHEALPASDIYSLGVSWYELLTGNTPSPSKISARRYEPPTALAIVNSLIARMMSFDPTDRPSADEVRVLLRGIPE